MSSMTISPRDPKNCLKASPFSFAAFAAIPKTSEQKSTPKGKECLNYRLFIALKYLTQTHQTSLFHLQFWRGRRFRCFCSFADYRNPWRPL